MLLELDSERVAVHQLLPNQDMQQDKVIVCHNNFQRVWTFHFLQTYYVGHS